MKILIAYSTNLGATKKAAQYLADKLAGEEVTLFDTSLASRPDFNLYDAVLFGTNVRMFRFNKRFRKLARFWNKEKRRAKAFVFVVGANFEKGDDYARKAACLVNNAAAGIFAGGELSIENASAFECKIISNVIAELRSKNQPLPALLTEKLDDLAAQIRAFEK